MLRLALIAALSWILANVVTSSAHAADLGTQVYQLFEAKCVRCHGEPGVKPGGGMDYILNFKKLRASPNVNLADPEQSVLYDNIATDYMPMKDKPLASSEKQLVLDWLKAGAPDAKERADAPDFVSPEDEAELVVDDLLSFNTSQRRSLPLLELGESGAGGAEH